MRNFTLRHFLCLTLTAGLCLGTLSTTGAADWADAPDRPPEAPAAVSREAETPTPEEEARAAAEAAARQSRAG